MARLLYCTLTGFIEMKLTYFEAYKEGKWHGDEDEHPTEDGQDPSANSDSRIAVVSCFDKDKQNHGRFNQNAIEPTRHSNTAAAEQ